MSLLGISGDEQLGPSGIGARITERSLRQRNKLIDYSMDTDIDGTVILNSKRRSILRTSKNASTVTESRNPTGVVNWKAIEKIYLQKSLGRVKNTNLETIFEDNADEGIDENSTVKKNVATAFGSRKLQRRLTFNTTKAMKDKRKRRALTAFGRKKRFKKVSMKNFLDHWNALTAVYCKKDTDVTANKECIKNDEMITVAPADLDPSDADVLI